MLVGIPKEIKNHEYRVGLTPAGVRELVVHGHEVLVETNAGQARGPVLLPPSPAGQRAEDGQRHSGRAQQVRQQTSGPIPGTMSHLV